MNYVISKNIENVIKYGVISEKGEIIVDLKYDSIQITNEYFIVKLNKAYGVTNYTDELFIEIEYENIEKCIGGFIVKKNNLYGIVNFSGELVCNIIYNKIYCNDGCFFVECDSRVGIIDNNYKNLVPVKFDTVSKHEIDNLYVVSIDDKYGIFDVQQNFGTDFLFDKIYNSGSKDFIAARLNDKYGFINKDGVWSINPIYDSVNDFDNNNLSIVRIGYRTGLIDKNENWILSPIFNSIQYLENNYLVLTNENKKLYFDNNGESINNEFIINNISRKKIEVVYKNYKYGLIDIDDNFIIEPNLDYLTEIKNNLYVFYTDSKLGLLNGKNEIVLEPKYEIKSWNLPSPNIIRVLLDDTYIFFELNNFNIIGEDISHVEFFRYGKNSIASNKLNKQGIVDENLNWLVFPIYDKLYCEDSNNLFKAVIGKKYGWIDINGNWKIKPIFDLNPKFESEISHFIIESLEFNFPEDSETFYLFDNIPSNTKINLDFNFSKELKHLGFIDDSLNKDFSSGIYISTKEEEVFLILVEKWSNPVVVSLNPWDENQRLNSIEYNEVECLLELTFEFYNDLPNAKRRLVLENETKDSIFKLNSTYIFSFYNKRMMKHLVDFVENVIYQLD